MLTPATVHEVRRWLDRGSLSQREIARMLKISRATVNAIATGQRLDERLEETDNTRPPVRCPHCGGLVQPPCRLCRIRRLKNESRRPAETRSKPEPRRRSA